MDEMHEKSDAQLLRGYAQHGDEAAFREIVTRHTDLVYSVAVRCVNSPDLACDIAQSVFTDLSSKARPLAEKLADGASLVGWLYSISTPPSGPVPPKPPVLGRMKVFVRPCQSSGT